MWIVRLALRRPYTFVVVALLLVMLGIVTVERMPTDIFPSIDIPVVTVDYGNIVEVVGGLSDKDRLLIAPPDDLQDGDLVRVIEGSDPNG